MKFTRTKLFRRIFPAVMLLIVFAFSINIYAGFYLRKAFDAAVLKNDTADYQLQVKHFYVNVWTGYICADDVSVVSRNREKKDSTNFIDAKIPSIAFSGVSLPSLFFHKKLRAGTCCFDHPAIQISNYDTTEKKNKEKVFFNLYSVIKSRFDALDLGKFIIEKGELLLSGKDSSDFMISIPEINVELSEIHADSSLDSSEKIMEAGNIELNIKGLQGHFMKGLYAFALPSLKLSSSDSLFTADSMWVRPTVDKKIFSKRAGFQTDCLDLQLTDLQIHSKKFMDLVEQQRIWLDTLEIKQMHLHAYRDKNIPRRPDNKPLPQSLLKSLPFQLFIAELVLDSADITYEELSPDAAESGAISFTRLNGTVTHISNIHMENDTMKLRGSAYMMNEALAGAIILFPLKEDKFFASINMESFDMKVLNSMIKNFTPIEIEEGKAKSMKMWCGADEVRGSGQMTFIYSGLKVAAIDKKNEAGNPIIKGLKNFVANKVILDADNPKDNLLRIGKIEYERDPQRNIINYCWNLIFSGFKSSMGIKGEKEKKLVK